MPISNNFYKFKFGIQRLGVDEVLMGLASHHVVGKIGLSEDSWALSHTGLLYHGETTVETGLTVDTGCSVDISVKGDYLTFKVSYPDGMNGKFEHYDERLSTLTLYPALTIGYMSTVEISR